MNTQKQRKMYWKNTGKKKRIWIRFEPSITVGLISVTPPMHSQSCSSPLGYRYICFLVCFFTILFIVTVDFGAGMEAGSINYLPYNVLHERLYALVKRCSYTKSSPCWPLCVEIPMDHGQYKEQLLNSTAKTVHVRAWKAKQYRFHRQDGSLCNAIPSIACVLCGL